VALDPSMFGMGGPPPGGPGGGMGGPGGMPDPMATPGGPSNPMANDALTALGGLNPKSPNPTDAIQKTLQALDLCYKLMNTILAQVQTTNPKAAKSAHGIARSILTMKSDLFEDAMPGPTPDLMLGMGAGGAPPAMGPQGSPPGAPMGAGSLP